MNKLLVICAVPPPFHGVAVYNSYILKSKLNRKFNLYHLDISDHRNINNLGKMDLINIFSGIKQFFRLIGVLIFFKPDLAYLDISQNRAYLRDGFFILLIKMFSNSKIIAHLHGSYFKQFYNSSNIILKSFIKNTLRFANTGIVLSSSLRFTLDSLVKNVKVLNNGIDFPVDFKEEEKYSYNNRINVSFLSILCEKKGLFVLIQAIEIIIKKYSNIKFHLAGDWAQRHKSFRKKAEDYICEHNLSEYINFVGAVSGHKKEDFFYNTDIFVFPAYGFEGQPLVILEAMAAGCPVIITDKIAHTSETVIDNKTGVLFEEKNHADLAEAIIFLSENPEIRKEMGIEGRKRFLENFMIEKNINGLMEIFKELVM